VSIRPVEHSSRVLSAESSLRPVPIVADLSLERLVDRFDVFFLALYGLGSVSRTGLDWRQSVSGFHHPRGNRGLIGNEKHHIVPISLHIRTASTSSALRKDTENDYSNHSWRPKY
jgi:hypothetical protein